MVYCEAKRIIEAYENKQGSIQSLISQSPSVHKNSLTCLVLKTLNYEKLLKKIIKRSKLLEREQFLGEKLAQLLVYDVLFGMGVRGKFKSVMKRNYDSLNESAEYYVKKYSLEKRDDLLQVFENTAQIKKPKYVYVNTLQLSKKEILKRLKQDQFVRIEENEEMKVAFKDRIQSIKRNEFLKDDHIKHMYIFSPDSHINIHHDLFKEGHLLQIDKSSCLVPIALDPPENSYVIDAASAPGNKTILLSNIMKNTGQIFAFDLSEERVRLMQENLKQHHVQNVELKCLDFLKTDPEKYSQVNYVLLDPSCSGSGMTNRFKYGIEENESVKDEKRLWNLEALQRRMIMHAMSFENVKRIVYSTCSIHEEENENVVRYALQNCKNKFKLVNLFPNKWYYGRGICHNSQDSHEYHLNYCIRTSYEKNFTNGFFIALFERQKEPFEENLILQ